MSKKQNKGRDPDKRATKRRAQREAAARGSLGAKATRAHTGLSTHASSGADIKQARDAERRMGRDGPIA